MADESSVTHDESISAVPERLVPGTIAWELYQVEHKQRYEWVTNYCAGKKVLDLACGTGYGSEILARNDASTVVGVDISADAVASKGKGLRGAFFLSADACKLPFSDHTFQVVVSFETIEHLENPERLLAEVARVLQSGGLCICSSPNRNFKPFTGGKEANPFHLSEMTYDEFDRLFTKHFDIVARFSQTHSEGYLRHLQLLRELNERLKQLRFSRLLRIEKKIRTLLGRDSFNGVESLPAGLGRAVPGDYVIEPLNEPSDRLLTFIFVGRAR
jgi:ubiquinone/menaquinone biosynthesis C-methylase UbiE